jgi:Family of unknown function (DUF6152)
MAPKVLSGVVLSVLAVWIGVVDAHHSVAGVFDNAKRARLTGTITRIEWINPHTYIYLDVKDENGEITTWRLESLPTAMLRKAGLTSQMLMGGGSAVTADALLARDGSAHLAWVLKLTYEDGHFYQLAGE